MAGIYLVLGGNRRKEDVPLSWMENIGSGVYPGVGEVLLRCRCILMQCEIKGQRERTLAFDRECWGIPYVRFKMVSEALLLPQLCLRPSCRAGLQVYYSLSVVGRSCALILCMCELLISGL